MAKVILIHFGPGCCGQDTKSQQFLMFGKPWYLKLLTLSYFLGDDFEGQILASAVDMC